MDRQEFVPIGERVQTYHGETKRIASKLPRPGPPKQVYNLEVYGEHVYFVGEHALLAHNMYEGPITPTLQRRIEDQVAQGIDPAAAEKLVRQQAGTVTITRSKRHLAVEATHGGESASSHLRYIENKKTMQKTAVIEDGSTWPIYPDNMKTKVRESITIVVPDGGQAVEFVGGAIGSKPGFFEFGKIDCITHCRNAIAAGGYANIHTVPVNNTGDVVSYFEALGKLD